MLTILHKELFGFLNSLTGYIVITVFLLINGLFLWVFPLEYNVLDFGYANLDGLFLMAPFIFLFLVPAITMRMFADENKGGTIEFLLTKPLTELQIILGKYVAGVLLVLFSLAPTFVYFASVWYLGYPQGNLDAGGIWGSYFGLLFLGASFTAIGLFASSLSDNQIVSFIVALFLCGFIYLGFEFIYSLNWFGPVDLLIRSLGIQAHYSSMSRGVIDTRDVLYFLSLSALFIMLTKYSTERRKW